MLHTFVVKYLNKLGMEENYLNLIKDRYKTSTATLYFLWQNFPSHIFSTVWPFILAHQELESIFGPLQSVEVYNCIDKCSKIEVIPFDLQGYVIKACWPSFHSYEGTDKTDYTNAIIILESSGYPERPCVGPPVNSSIRGLSWQPELIIRHVSESTPR